MPVSMAVQRACTLGLSCASLARLHSPALSLVSCTSYSQVRTLRPPTALLLTATLPLKSALNWPPQPTGQGPPVATVESPAIHTLRFDCTPPAPPLPAWPAAPAVPALPTLVLPAEPAAAALAPAVPRPALPACEVAPAAAVAPSVPPAPAVPAVPAPAVPAPGPAPAPAVFGVAPLVPPALAPLAAVMCPPAADCAPPAPDWSEPQPSKTLENVSPSRAVATRRDGERLICSARGHGGGVAFHGSRVCHLRRDTVGRISLPASAAESTGSREPGPLVKKYAHCALIGRPSHTGPAGEIANLA